MYVGYWCHDIFCGVAVASEFAMSFPLIPMWSLNFIQLCCVITMLSVYYGCYQ